MEPNDPYHNKLKEFEMDGGYGEDEFVWAAEQTSGSYADDDDSDVSTVDDDELNFEPEWELPVKGEPPVEEEPPVDEDEDEDNQCNSTHCQDIQLRAQGQRGCVVVPYPDPHAGQQITNQAANCYAANVEYGAQFNAEQENLYHPFTLRMDWEVARWAKLCGLGLTALSDLLAIEGVCECLSLSVVAGKAFDVYYHDVIECVRSLYSDPDFARYLAFVPEQHYADEDKTVWLFHDMHTGKWWWDTQHSLGGTIIPIIILSNKTQLTLFCNKAAYPPSHGGHILLAYLPCTQLEHITNKASHRQTMANLYHACLHRVLTPLKSVRLDGLCMASGDGALCCCHLFFANFVGDYPEQLLATGIKFGECPKCDVDADETGSNTAPFHLWKMSKVLDALTALDDGNLSFVRACSAAGIKPIVHPFWEDLSFTNIFCAIILDVLHQLYQGLVKHLLGWLSAACGPAKIDAHCQCLPPNHHICLFRKGITGLLRISGTKLRGLLDFLYFAQYPCHSSETLQLLDDALNLFHNNKYTERLHIDDAKDTYCATNHKDELVQMTHWLEQKEKILRYEKYIDWRLAGDVESEPYHLRPPDMTFHWLQKMTKHPSAKAVNIDKLVKDYGTTYFCEVLAHYITQLNHANAHTRTLDVLARDVHLPFRTLPWLSVDSCGLGDAAVTLDSVHARPQRTSSSCLSAHRSDTALVRLGPNTDASMGMEGVMSHFSLPSKSLSLLVALTVQIPSHLAYIEWFMPFRSTPDQCHRLYKLSRSFRGGEELTSIVPLANIVRSVHLIPNFGAIVPQEWTSDTVLDDCNTFWLNSYLDRYTFCNL
ncbi:uncharacterized protein EDB93DRAFT_1323215 [Suillus bovinus]|uniref:uncharacterized protein n=1 Tax=Suillus bovinus TaxID=48563 RepID=UPI001B873980|nr:uncharacterized protein EDB93DRAFT_1323215 [Suillus bovinus]KAG2131435.1 hypothetical protein EDB93DRAFT_1323215 [Suillus bovinus]